MQECGSWSWNPASLVAIVLGVVVQQHGLNAFKGFPRDVSRVDIIDANPPLLHGEPDLLRTKGSRVSGKAAGAPVDKGSRVGRILEDLQDDRHRWLFPDDISEAISSGQSQVLSVEEPQHLAGRTQPQKGGKNQIQAILNLLMRIFVDVVKGVTHQPDWEREGQFPTSSFVQESGSHACSDGVQLQLGELAFEAQEQASIGRARIVDPIVVSDETAPIAAHIQQRIPIGAVAREAGHLHRQNDAHLAQRHFGYQFLKTCAMLSRGCGQAEIGINDLHILGVPAQALGALLEGVLQAQALLIGDLLMRRGLPDVNDRFLLQVLRRDQFGCAHGLPPAGSTRGRQGWCVEGLGTAVPRELSDQWT